MKDGDIIQNVAVYLGSADVHNQVFRQAVIDLANFLADHNMTLVFGLAMENECYMPLFLSRHIHKAVYCNHLPRSLNDTFATF